MLHVAQIRLRIRANECRQHCPQTAVYFFYAVFLLRPLSSNGERLFHGKLLHGSVDQARSLKNWFPQFGEEEED